MTKRFLAKKILHRNGQVDFVDNLGTVYRDVVIKSFDGPLHTPKPGQSLSCVVEQVHTMPANITLTLNNVVWHVGNIKDRKKRELGSIPPPEA